jgi:hypothetical protein
MALYKVGGWRAVCERLCQMLTRVKILGVTAGALNLARNPASNPHKPKHDMRTFLKLAVVAAVAAGSFASFTADAQACYGRRRGWRRHRPVVMVAPLPPPVVMVPVGPGYGYAPVPVCSPPPVVYVHPRHYRRHRW